MKKDRALLAEDTQRKENCQQAIEILEKSGVPEWAGFSDQNSRVICIRGGKGQMHVGDVFRAVFPTLEYFKSRNIKLVLASSPGLESMFQEWRHTLKIIDGSQSPDILVEEFQKEGIQSIIKWGSLHRSWKALLRRTFGDKIRTIPATPHLSVPLQQALTLRQTYSENGLKKVLGIIWRTSMIGRDPSRNAKLSDFKPLVKHNPKEWNVVSLQYGSLDATEEEVERFNRKNDANIIFDKNIDPMRDYAGAAAQMVACDHIISIDCSQIFQAGACGVPVSALLSADPAKQWGEFMQTNTDICPFFPETARIFTQKKDAEWDRPVGQALARAVADSDKRGKWGHPAAQNLNYTLKLAA